MTAPQIQALHLTIVCVIKCLYVCRPMYVCVYRLNMSDLSLMRSGMARATLGRLRFNER